MTIGWNGALSRRLALGGLIALTFLPAAATAQWLAPPWRAAFPGEIAQSLEARGYVLTAPLLRRPGIYIADVEDGPAGSQRLIIDSRSGRILESFPASVRMWGPVLASRGEEFGERGAPGMGGPPPGGGFSGPPAAGPATTLAPGGSAGDHIPAAISPYGPGAAPAGTKSKIKAASLEHKRPWRPIANPPLPPPAPPREAPKADEAPPPASKSAEDQGSDRPRVEPPLAPQASTAEASDKPKISIVPPSPFE